MTTIDRANWPPVLSVAPALVCQVPPAGAVFLDSNVVFNASRFVKLVEAPLISSVVLAEILRRHRRESSRPGDTIALYLQKTGIRVVPFGPEDALTFLTLTQQIDFSVAPWKLPTEDKRTCTDRLRFDLLIFATALRYQKLLITSNTTEFALFPHGDCWLTPEQYLAGRN